MKCAADLIKIGSLLTEWAWPIKSDAISTVDFKKILLIVKCSRMCLRVRFSSTATTSQTRNHIFSAVKLGKVK